MADTRDEGAEAVGFIFDEPAEEVKEPVVETPAPDPAPAVAPVEEAPAPETAPVVEETETETEETGETETTTTDDTEDVVAEEDTVESLRAKMAAQREEFLALLEGHQPAVQPPAEVKKPDAPETVEEKPVPHVDLDAQISGLSFFKSDEDLANFFRDPESANKTLQDIVRQSVALGIETATKRMPEVAESTMRETFARRAKAVAFYSGHPDLIPHQKWVGLAINNLASKNPDWDENKLLEEGAKTTRRMLGLAEPSTKVTKEEKAEAKSGEKHATFSPGTGARKPLKQTGKTQAERDVDDLLY